MVKPLAYKYVYMLIVFLLKQSKINHATYLAISKKIMYGMSIQASSFTRAGLQNEMKW